VLIVHGWRRRSPIGAGGGDSPKPQQYGHNLDAVVAARKSAARRPQAIRLETAARLRDPKSSAGQTEWPLTQTIIRARCDGGADEGAAPLLLPSMWGGSDATAGQVTQCAKEKGVGVGVPPQSSRQTRRRKGPGGGHSWRCAKATLEARKPGNAAGGLRRGGGKAQDEELLTSKAATLSSSDP